VENRQVAVLLKYHLFLVFGAGCLAVAIYKSCMSPFQAGQG
jgi:hypothetical protein